MDNNELPKGWEKVKLKDFSEIIMGQSPPSSTYNEEKLGLPFFQGKTEFGETYPSVRKYCAEPKKIAEEGDILISVRAPVGPTNVNPYQSCVGRGLAAIHPLSGISSKFILYLLRNDEVHIAGQGTGTTFKAISKAQLENLKFFLPPLPEQHRIVAKIEALFSELDHGVAQMHALLSQLKTYRQAVLKYAFEGKLTEQWRKKQRASDTIALSNRIATATELLEKIRHERQSRYQVQLTKWEAAKARSEKVKKPRPPKEFPPLTEEEVKGLPDLPEEWMWVKTGNVIDPINNGYTPTSEYLFRDNGEVPFIKVYNLNFDGSFNFKKDPTFIPEEIHKKNLTRSITYPGDVLINIVGPPLGKVSIVTNQYPEWNINQAIVMFRPDEFVTSKFISYFMQNPQTIHWLEATSKATAGQYNVKVSTCRGIPIPICSLPEQHQIVSAIESRLSICEQAEAVLRQQLEKSEALRQSILKKAFEGKLVPQDPNDEPAAVLLSGLKWRKPK